MKSSGEKPRRIFRAPTGYGLIEALAWSPDGRQLAFGRRDRAAAQLTISTIDPETGAVMQVLSDPAIRGFTWARNGRIIYARVESLSTRLDANLWETAVDVRNGRTSVRPRRLTNWTDFNCTYLNVSADGKRLSFIRERSHSDVYVAELSTHGDRLTSRRQLTFDEWIDWPTAWTQRGDELLFHSNRRGALAVFRQGLNKALPEVVVSDQNEIRDARLSPDGQWILYFAWPENPARTPGGEGRLMRSPRSGGEPQTVFAVAGHSGPAADEHASKRPVPYGGEGNPRFRCSALPHGPCVLSEKLDEHIVFTAFDPLKGRGSEVAKLKIERNDPYFWDLSPDGRRIAFGISDETSGRIRLISLSGALTREISTTGWTNFTSVAWASNGAALFAAGWASKGSPLLRISLDGKARLLYRSSYHLENAIPSRDARHLAFGEVASEGNVWLVDNLR
jgi:Tol biopolymer transport system component